MNEREFITMCAARNIEIDTACKCHGSGASLLGLSRAQRCVVIQPLGMFGAAKGDPKVIDAAKLRSVTTKDYHNPISGLGFHHIVLDINEYGSGLVELLAPNRKTRDDLYSKIGYLISETS